MQLKRTWSEKKKKKQEGQTRPEVVWTALTYHVTLTCLYINLVGS